MKKNILKNLIRENIEGMEEERDFIQAYGDSILERIDDGIYSFEEDGKVYIWENGDVKELYEWGQYNIDYLSRKYSYSENFNRRFWDRPEPLFHFTPKENIDSIMEYGLTTSRLTSSPSNKNINEGVFTVTYEDFVEYDTTYGNAVIKIDTSLMNKDGNTPFVSQEPDVAEYNILSSFFHKYQDYGIEATMETGNGSWENTVIVYSEIDPKYLSIYKINK